MHYHLLKIYVRAAIHLFCHSIYIDKKELLSIEGPLLIASNHPNSFLDAIIFDIVFDIPITSLARGDAFRNKKVFRVLRSLKMLPIYRIREGAENLNTNYETFDTCIDLFKQREAVLIFSEGLCVNEWHLRPLKKGTARLAFKAWSEGIPLKVLPAGINYSSFKKYGKAVHILFGDVITAEEADLQQSDGLNYALFNKTLKSRLQPLVYEINSGDTKTLKKKFGLTSTLRKVLLAPLALAGAILNAPVYGSVKYAGKVVFGKTDHYNAVVFGLLLLSYPIYLAILTTIAYSLLGQWGLLTIIALPLTALCYMKYEIRLD